MVFILYVGMELVEGLHGSHMIPYKVGITEFMAIFIFCFSMVSKSADCSPTTKGFGPQNLIKRFNILDILDAL